MSRIQLIQIDLINRRELIIMMIQDYKHVTPGLYRRRKAPPRVNADRLVVLACCLIALISLIPF